MSSRDTAELDDAREYFVAFKFGAAELTDHEGLVATLESLTEREWYLGEIEPEVPDIWAAVPGAEYQKVHVVRHSDTRRSGLQETWALYRSDTRELIQRLSTSFTPQ